MDGDEELSTAVIGGLDSLLKVCAACYGFVHGGVVDCVPELLQLGDKGFDNGSVYFTLSETFIFGSVSGTRCCVPGVDAYLDGYHLLCFLVLAYINKDYTPIISHLRVSSCIIFYPSFFHNSPIILP